MCFLTEQVLEQEETQHFSNPSSGTSDRESDPYTPNETDDEENDFVTSQRREREDDEDQDGVDVGHWECDNIVFVRFELYESKQVSTGTVKGKEREVFSFSLTFSTIVSR